MKRTLAPTVTACLLLLAVAATAQEAPPRVDELVGIALTSPELRDAAPELLDRVGGRVTGTPAGERAQALAERVLRQAGVPLVRREPFEVPVWRPRRVTLALEEPTRQRLPALPLWSSGTTQPQGLVAPVVDAGHGTPEELAALGERVAGAAVLVGPGVPEGHRWLHRSEKYAAAVAARAAAFLYAPEDPEAPARAGTVSLEGAPGSIPALSLDGAVGSRLRRLAAEGGCTVRIVLLADRVTGTAANVVADIPGRRPEEMVLVGAHLDSWDLAQGAWDNGAGTLVLWQAAAALVAFGQRPLRTVRFVCFMGEEQGLLGSKAYVERHRAELGRIRAMLNLDMVGEPTGFGEMLQPGLDPLLERLARRLAGLGLATKVASRPGLFSDHGPFLLAGVPVVTVRSHLPEAVGRAYHSRLDIRDLLDEGMLQRAAAVTSALVWTLANADPLPTRQLDPAEARRLLEEADVPAAAIEGAVPHASGS